jgi:hypothetical protein
VAVNSKTELTVLPWIPATSPAADDQSAIAYLMHEVQRLRATVADLVNAAPQATDAAPLHPRNGMIRYAEGAWGTALGSNGLYVYDGGVWTALSGDYIESNILAASAVALTNGVNANITSIVLTPGDWQVGGNLTSVAGAGAVISQIFGGANDVTAAFSDSSLFMEMYTNGTANFNGGGAVPTRRFTVASGATKTVYLVVNIAFTNTCKACGNLWARRLVR